MSKKELIDQKAREILSLLGIKNEVEVKEKEGIFEVKIETAESGILIGYHGETLAALQLLLSQMIWRQSGEWTRITVDVGDYRARREEVIKEMALAAAKQVETSGQACILPPMPANERRIVHLTLAEDAKLQTQSEGEGRWRRVVVQPRTQASA